MKKYTRAERNFLIYITRLYYIEGLTHQEIASHLGFSRIKITRLLKKAVVAKIVEFRIAQPEPEISAPDSVYGEAPQYAQSESPSY
ncbi:MAG: hypothetical protein HQK83_16300 [Fibrobacteria bacterium]|nr:hypothetical protein [Fibrobacteria bacterium]